MSVPSSKMKTQITLDAFPKEPAARVRYAMKKAGLFLINYDKPPSRENLIKLNGEDPDELAYMWTALMVFGERLPGMYFDSSAIKIGSLFSAFDKTKELGSVGYRFSKDSLYERVFKYFLTEEMIQLPKKPLFLDKKPHDDHSHKPLCKFLDGEYFPEGDSERVKYSLALANKTLYDLSYNDKPPTLKKPIYLRGNHYEQLRYVWTAFMVYGQRLFLMKFGSEAIKIESPVFSATQELGWWPWVFSSTSLYETVFKYHLSDAISLRHLLPSLQAYDGIQFTCRYSSNGLSIEEQETIWMAKRKGVDPLMVGRERRERKKEKLLATKRLEEELKREKDQLKYREEQLKHQEVQDCTKPLQQFLDGAVFPDGESQRVKYALALASSTLAKLKKPPTTTEPIFLSGNHYEHLRYVWTAFMVYGQQFSQMRFGSEALKITTQIFSEKNEFSSYWPLYLFSSQSLYETVFKNYLPAELTLTECPELFEEALESGYKTLEQQESFLCAQNVKKIEYQKKLEEIDQKLEKEKKKLQELNEKIDQLKLPKERPQEREGQRNQHTQAEQESPTQILIRLTRERKQQLQVFTKKNSSQPIKQEKLQLQKDLIKFINDCSCSEQTTISHISQLIKQGVYLNYIYSTSYELVYSIEIQEYELLVKLETVLKRAVNNKRYQVAEFLLKNGADGAAFRDRFSWINDVPKGSSLEQLIEKMLKDQYAESDNQQQLGKEILEKRNKLSATLLHEVGKKGMESQVCISKINQLVRQGANIDYASPLTQDTALMRALLFKKYSVAEYLVKQAANARIPNKEGATAMNLVQPGSDLHTLILQKEKERALSQSLRPEKYSCLLSKDVAETEGERKRMSESLRLGADINHRNTEGYTALMLAALAGESRTVEYLLRSGANPVLINKNGLTARQLVPSSSTLAHTLKGYELLFAVSKNNLAAVKKLLRREPNVIINFQDAEGYTALMIAAAQNKRELVEFLLTLQPSLKIRTNQDQTIFEICHQSILKLLMQYVELVSIEKEKTTPEIMSFKKYYDDHYQFFKTKESSSNGQTLPANEKQSSLSLSFASQSDNF